MSSQDRIGVGIIGAGSGTQAMHIPSLVSLADRFRVTHVMDTDEQVASVVASRVGARSTTRLEPLLDDPEVDVVVICTPPHLHADQLVAAAKAGKRAILCEKPLVTTADDAYRVAATLADTGVPLMVGTMHAHDPAWIAARPFWEQVARAASLVRSTIYLVPNPELIDLSTDLVAPLQAPPPAGEITAQMRAERMRGLVLGVAIHAIPQIRQFFPRFDRVSAVRATDSVGYRFVLTADDGRSAELSFLGGSWTPEWTLQAWGSAGEVHVSYPPPFVLAGSATVTHSGPDGTRQWRYPVSGYEGEWAHLANVVEGKTEPAVPVQKLIDDILFAIELADQAAASILENA